MSDEYQKGDWSQYQKGDCVFVMGSPPYRFLGNKNIVNGEWDKTWQTHGIDTKGNLNENVFDTRDDRGENKGPYIKGKDGCGWFYGRKAKIDPRELSGGKKSRKVKKSKRKRTRKSKTNKRRSNRKKSKTCKKSSMRGGGGATRKKLATEIMNVFNSILKKDKGGSIDDYFIEDVKRLKTLIKDYLINMQNHINCQSLWWLNREACEASTMQSIQTMKALIDNKETGGLLRKYQIYNESELNVINEVIKEGSKNQGALNVSEKKPMRIYDQVNDWDTDYKLPSPDNEPPEYSTATGVVPSFPQVTPPPYKP